jgi:hypothetical protein
MWGRMESCGGLATRPERRLPTGAQIANLPHKGAHSHASRPYLPGAVAPSYFRPPAGAALSSGFNPFL